MMQDRAICTTADQQQVVYQMVPFSITLMTRSPDFNVTALFDTECLKNGMRYRNSFNGILIGPGLLKVVISNYLE